MSNGPCGADSDFKAEKRFNIVLGIRDWCSYKGECRQDLNIASLCYNCKWMEKFDIPALIGEKLKDGSK